MTDAAKIKAFEKMKEEINRVSSPQLTNTTTTVTNTSSEANVNVAFTETTKLSTEFCDSDIQQPSTMKNNVLSTSPSCSTITSLNSNNTNTEVISNTLHFQPTNIIDNGSDIKMDYLNSITPTSSNSGLDLSKSTTNQSLRDREFRAQQSQPNVSISRNTYRPLASTSNVDNIVNKF